MERREFVRGCAATGTLLFLPSAALAEEKVSGGEIWVSLKGADYAKPYFDGSEYEDHEFEKNGYKLIIRIEDYSKPYTFELRASVGGFTPVEITSKPQKFRPTRVSGTRERRWVYKTKVKFNKSDK